MPGRPHQLSDDADAVFFRAVARDRHPTTACPASRTLRGYEERFSGVLNSSLTSNREAERQPPENSVLKTPEAAKWGPESGQRSRV